jgi:16S rRNA (uracil1498-N3)-methyltransferase
MGQVHALLIPGLHLKPGTEIALKDLPKDEQKHLKALRIRSGEKLDLLNGEGSVYSLECQGESFRLIGTIQKPALLPQIELGLSFPKKESLWEAISQATELGVARIFPINSQHNQNPKGAKLAMAERAQKIADEACCQCRQAYRVEIPSDWLDLETWLSDSQAEIFFADEFSAQEGLKPQVLAAPGRRFLEKSPTKLRLLVGPEGGWSESERSLLLARAHRLSLGPQVLRVPTAIAVGLYHLRYFLS